MQVSVQTGEEQAAKRQREEEEGKNTGSPQRKQLREEAIFGTFTATEMI